MARILAAPFYAGYSYNIGDRFVCTFIEGDDGLWVVEICAPTHDVPVFVTPRVADRYEAYRLANAWCDSNRCAAATRAAELSPQRSGGGR